MTPSPVVLKSENIVVFDTHYSNELEKLFVFYCISVPNHVSETVEDNFDAADVLQFFAERFFESSYNRRANCFVREESRLDFLDFSGMIGKYLFNEYVAEFVAAEISARQQENVY